MHAGLAYARPFQMVHAPIEAADRVTGHMRGVRERTLGVGRRAAAGNENEDGVPVSRVTKLLKTMVTPR